MTYDAPAATINVKSGTSYLDPTSVALAPNPNSFPQCKTLPTGATVTQGGANSATLDLVVIGSPTAIGVVTGLGGTGESVQMTSLGNFKLISGQIM